MKPFDFALILVRIAALTSVIEGSIGVPFAILRLIIALYGPVELRHYALFNMTSELTFPAEEIGVGLLFLIFSKSIARFGAKVIE